VRNSKQLSIVVVDDEQIIATTLTLILQNSGYLAQAFFNPLQALAAARLEAPDLVISDVVMPQLTGVELAIQIRAMWPSCKVILLSGQAQTGDLLSVAREQGHDFNLLPKPVHPVDLLRYIREHELLYS
jgi:CheY-like chemotaxis protein